MLIPMYSSHEWSCDFLHSSSLIFVDVQGAFTFTHLVSCTYAAYMFTLDVDRWHDCRLSIWVASPGFGARTGTCISCWVFTGGNCQHIVAVRLCTGQSALEKLNCCKSRGARAPVPHSWRRQWLAVNGHSLCAHSVNVGEIDRSSQLTAQLKSVAGCPSRLKVWTTSLR